MIQNKRGNVANGVFMWIFACFFYFTIGIKILTPIVKSLNTFEGMMSFMAEIIPFIPVLALMWWGYTILTPDEQGRAEE